MAADFTHEEVAEAERHEARIRDTNMLERMFANRGVAALVFPTAEDGVLSVRVWPADVDKVPARWGVYALVVTKRAGSWD